MKTKYLDEYFFRLERNKQESVGAWALCEEKVFLQMTRARARLEQTVDLTGTCCVNVNKTGANGTIGLAHGERIKIVMRTRALTEMETLFCTDNTSPDAHTRTFSRCTLHT